METQLQKLLEKERASKLEDYGLIVVSPITPVNETKWYDYKNCIKIFKSK